MSQIIPKTSGMLQIACISMFFHQKWMFEGFLIISKFVLQKKNLWNCIKTELKILRKREFDSSFFFWWGKVLRFIKVQKETKVFFFKMKIFLKATMTFFGLR